MSGHTLTRGRRLMGKIGAAALIATLTGAPSELLAGKPPKPPKPPPPPSIPQPQPLNADPNVRWFADWHVNTAAGAPMEFFATPTNSPPGNPTGSVGFMQTQLNASAAQGAPLGIKVEVPLSGADAGALFNTQYGTGKRAVSYVFADFEGGTHDQVLTNIGNLVNQVRGSDWSRNAYVGQWDLTPLDRVNDRFYRTPGAQVVGSLSRPWGKAQYDSFGLNMANTQLYPGAADFRNKSTGDWQGGSIRGGLFIGPIGRMTLVQNVLDQNYGGKNLAAGTRNHKQIPWIARFNNFGNAALDNADMPNAPFAFVPGQPLPQAGLSGEQTAGQMLGRGDVSAMARHYRMRGAYSVNLFEPGVVGYTQTQFQQDVRIGWAGDARLNNIMAQGDNQYATMTLNPIVVGAGMNDRAEKTESIWSGQYSLSAPNPASKAGKGDMVILASNMDNVDHLIKFGMGETPYEIYLKKNEDGYTWEDSADVESSRNALIAAGMHKVFNFDLVETRVYDSFDLLGSNQKKTYSLKTIWLLSSSYNVFGNNSGRNDIGIPEPTTFGSLAAAGAIGLVCRRQRRNR